MNPSTAKAPATSPRYVLALLAALLIGSAFATRAEDGSATNTHRVVRFREAGAPQYRVPVPAKQPVNQAIAPATEWTVAQPVDGSTNVVEFGNRVVLQLAPGTPLDSFLTNRTLALARTVAPDVYILQAPDTESAIAAAEEFAARAEVVTCHPVTRRALRPHNALAPVPNDSYFTNQWHLDNRGAGGNLVGPDLNVRAAWPQARGSNVMVAVADEGVQQDHPDMTNRLAVALNYNFFSNVVTGAPYATNANHGTAVAGLIGAEADNGRGVAGVAPLAKVASWVIFGRSIVTGQEIITTDERLMDAFQFQSNAVAVQNHSWGSSSTAMLPLGTLSDIGVSNAVTHGRNGKGVIIIRAAGNERENLTNANDDGYGNDPRVIAVAAIRKDGRACGYSSPGASLLVSGPSGDFIDSNFDGIADAQDPNAPDVWTTDRTGALGYNTTNLADAADYAGFKGTSAAAPEVAGVVALMLSVNTNLTYRDVQHLLVHSARQFDLADPGLRTNGAGFRFSHNTGFGVPDAGYAVELAKNWSNVPPATRVSYTNISSQPIPDDSLRVVCNGAGISSTLTNIRCLPSLGVHPDAPTPALPLVFVGLATNDLTVDLHGKGALIQRGIALFSEKIARAAKAGAAFAVIFNHSGGTAIQFMGGTTYVPIPAVSIGQTDGEALRDYVLSNANNTAQLQLSPVVYPFNVTNTLICEHVGVRLKTTHTSRSDVRVTLVSPAGTRSVLQAINFDAAAGPADWTYWSAQHFYESSYGQWRVEVSDERNTTLSVFPFSSATGTAAEAQLIINGVPINDTDHDGLEDTWEQQFFGSLAQGPRDDPDRDGFNNAREQRLKTNPTVADKPLTIDFSDYAAGTWRLSWPSADNTTFSLLTSTNLSNSWITVTNLAGRPGYGEFIVPRTNSSQFWRVQRAANP